MKKIFLVCILLFLSGCKDKLVTYSPENKVIFPLKVGNYWIFSSNYYDSSGSSMSSTFDTISIKDYININSEKWFYLNLSNDVVVTNKDGGVWIWEDWNYGESPNLLFKYPGKINDSFLGGVNQSPTSIEGINIAVNVSAGNFQCYYYKIRYASGETENYYVSPNIGIVKSEHYHLDNSRNVKELINYHLE